MDAYRLNIRLNRNDPQHRRIAEYLEGLASSRNRFVLDAISAQIDREEDSPLTETDFRRILREELQNIGTVAVIEQETEKPSSFEQPFSLEATADDEERNKALALASMGLFR